MSIHPLRLPRYARLLRACFLFTLLLAALGSPSTALAAPEAHILRIDPRASLADGAPILTTVVEMVQNKRTADITSGCADQTDEGALFDCMSDRLEQPQALYSPIAFKSETAFLFVTVDGTDIPATFVSAKRWKEAKSDDGVGTAWLILIDAAAGMGPRFNEAQAVAKEFVNAMGPQDIVNIMFFNDRAIVKDSKWTDKKSDAAAFVDTVTRTFPAQASRGRPLANIIKQGATDGFKDLGNVGNKVRIPLHQAMVILSNGSGGTDTGSASQTALFLRKYMTDGRFPEDNQTLPKSPVPIVSIWFPKKETDELFRNANEFMENLANTEIGGFYSIVRDGQSSRAPRIVQAVRQRFDETYIIQWRVSCIAPTVGQTFKLVFKNTDPPIAGDNFINVPVGIDPTSWPLDLNIEETQKAAKKNKVYPGGTVTVFGNFCWGSDLSRAQLYLIPKNQPVPESLKGHSIEEAQKAQQQLVASKLVGKAVNAGDGFVEFEVPDSTKFLSGKGNKQTARLVVYDTRAKRTSAITADKILTLPADAKPLPLLLIGALVFGGVVLILLVVLIFKSGGGRRRSSAATPPPPVVAPGPGGYGAPR